MKKKFALGIDIGGTNTAFGLVDEDGNVVAETMLKIHQYAIICAPIFSQYAALTGLVNGKKNVLQKMRHLMCMFFTFLKERLGILTFGLRKHI